MKHDRRVWIGTVCLVMAGLWTAMAGADDIKADQSTGKPASTGGTTASDAHALAVQIDRLLAAKWAEAKVQPARAADDAEYLRRVYLDLIGQLPTPAEQKAFLEGPAKDRRTALV